MIRYLIKIFQYVENLEVRVGADVWTYRELPFFINEESEKIMEEKLITN